MYKLISLILLLSSLGCGIKSTQLGLSTNGPLLVADNKGDSGKDGKNGLNGIKGDIGAKGDAGLQGATGLQGANGSKGDKGDTGAKGDSGSKGDKGDTGAKGDTGVQGVAGPQGAAGKDGTQVMMVQFCPAVVGHYGIFPEYGTCVNGIMYGVYWDGKNAWQAEIYPGNYQSTATGLQCTFTLTNNCVVTQ